MRKLLIAVFLAVCTFLVSAAGVRAASSPQWLNAVPTGEGEVTLYWGYASGAGAKEYNVSYGKEEVDQFGVLGVGKNQNIMMEYTVKGLESGAEYCFAVSAQQGKEKASAYSPVDCAYATGGYKRQVVQTDENGKVIEQKEMKVEKQDVQKEPVGASTQQKSQGTMRTEASLRSAEVTTGRRGAGEYNLRAVSGEQRGDVTLFWNDHGAENYHVMYTDEEGNWKYGQLNVGDQTAYTLKNLSSGQRYWFALVPVVKGEVQAETVSVSELAR